MTDTTRQRLLDTGLFTERTASRDLVCEAGVTTDGPAIRVVLSFDSFGDLAAVRASVIDHLEQVVAGNRQALGLPPQET